MTTGLFGAEPPVRADDELDTLYADLAERGAGRGDNDLHLSAATTPDAGDVVGLV